MHTQSQLAHLHAADLRAQAEQYRLAARVRPSAELRTRLGWTLVEVGLRLASAPRPSRRRPNSSARNPCPSPGPPGSPPRPSAW